MSEETKETTSLFNKEHIELIKKSYEDWFNNCLRDVDREM